MDESLQPAQPAPAETPKPESRPVTQYQQVNFNFNLGQVLPDPDKLHQYPPRMIEAMVEMAREEQIFRHKVVLKDQDHKMCFERRAQICTLISYLVLFVIGGGSVILGHAGFGATLMTAAFITAIGSSFFNRADEQIMPEEEPPKPPPDDSQPKLL